MELKIIDVCKSETEIVEKGYRNAIPMNIYGVRGYQGKRFLAVKMVNDE